MLDIDDQDFMPEIEWEKVKDNEEIKISPTAELTKEQMISFKMVEQLAAKCVARSYKDLGCLKDQEFRIYVYDEIPIRVPLCRKSELKLIKSKKCWKPILSNCHHHHHHQDSSP
jgi:hypothetical protein